MIYTSGDEVRVGDVIERKHTVDWAGQHATITHLSDRSVISDFPGHNDVERDCPDGTKRKAWANNASDFAEYWQLVSRAGAKVKTVGVKFVAPPFQVKGRTPQLQLSIGCKTFNLVGFAKRAAKVKRLLKVGDGPDAQVTVMGESGVKAEDIDGLLAWLDKELKKI